MLMEAHECSTGIRSSQCIIIYSFFIHGKVQNKTLVSGKYFKQHLQKTGVSKH